MSSHDRRVSLFRGIVVGLVVITGSHMMPGVSPEATAGPSESIQQKMQQVQQGIQRWQHAGRDPSPVGRIMQEFEPLMQAGKFQEAEAVLDRALALLDEKPSAEVSSSFAEQSKPISPEQHITAPRSIKLGKIPETAEIVYHQDGYIYVMDQNGGNVTQIAFGAPRAYEHVAVSFNHRYIVADEHPSSDPGSAILLLYDLDKGTAIRLLPDYYFAGDGGVSWDSKGYIYFVAKEKKSDTNIDVYKIKYDGTGFTRLTNTPLEEHDVGISEDDSMIAYLILVPDPAINSAHTEVWIANPDGSNPRKVYTSGAVLKASAHDPEVSPAQRKAAFSIVNSTVSPNFPNSPGANTAHDIWTINFDGTGLTRLTKPGPISIAPNWIDDKIVYTELSAHYSGAAIVDSHDKDQTPKRIRAGANAPKWIPK